MKQTANIVDYIEWRGDLGFDLVPFTDVDNVVLAVLSYLDFTGIVPSEEDGYGIRLSDACAALRDKIDDNIDAYVKSLAHVGIDYLEAITESSRFGNATLSSYTDMLDSAHTVQFAALRIDLRDGPTYISFRGTDSTLVGWKEDFFLSFRMTEAQELARGYLERAVATRHDKPILVGGHSKGGVLAEYAVACCDEETRRHVAHVYSNDGPGIDPQVLPIDIRSILGDKLTLIVPTYSLVGMLYARDDDRRIVIESRERGAVQHDPTSWLVTPTGMKAAADLLPECKAVNSAIASWADGVPLDDRERIVNEVFDALEAGGAETIHDVVSTADRLQRVLVALDDCDPRTKESARRLIESIVASSMNAATQSAKAAAEKWKRNALMIIGASTKKLATNGSKREIPKRRYPEQTP